MEQQKQNQIDQEQQLPADDGPQIDQKLDATDTLYVEPVKSAASVPAEEVKPVEKAAPEAKPKLGCLPIWVIKGAMAALTMGVGQFIFAVYYSGFGLIGTAILGPVPLLLLILFKIQIAVRNKMKLGTFINKEKSNIFDPDGNYRWKNLIPLIGNWVANTGHVFLFTYAFRFAKMGGLNQGIIPIVTTLATLYNSIIFYKAFGEKVSMPKVFGMMFTVGCVVFLALDSSSRKKVAGSDVDPIYALYSLICGFFVPIGFSTKHYLIRKYKGSYDSNHLPLDSAILESISCAVFIPFYIAEKGMFTTHSFIIGSIGGLLMVAGRILVAMAVAEGYGGPAQSLMSCNTIYTTILTITVDGQMVTLLQLLGLLSGLTGSAIIATGDQVIASCRSKSEKVEPEPAEPKADPAVAAAPTGTELVKPNIVV